MTTPTPPRLTGNPKLDNDAIVSWAYALYKDIVIEQSLPQRVQAMDALTSLTTAISNPPTLAEVTALKDKINAIITALQTRS